MSILGKLVAVLAGIAMLYSVIRMFACYFRQDKALNRWRWQAMGLLLLAVIGAIVGWGGR
ncbi:MAG: hypothetical protein FJ280_23490 [Planctomycetes bacterium]|nr:hypothetical protein [Planctomycetota bacterium]